MEATFVQGSPLMVPHTPGSAVAAGEVLVAGTQVRIPHLPIAANAKGSVAAGGGVYDVAKAGGAGVTFADGADVYWDATNNLAVATDGAGANVRIGAALGAAADAATSVRVQHIPN